MLRSVDPAGGPASTFKRDLACCDRQVADAAQALGDVPYREAALRAWRRARAAPPWDGPRVWMHGDLHPANLLVTDGQLSGVIDFGGISVGDPAVDLMAAWTFLPEPARRGFRDAVQADEAAWERGRGWAVLFGVRCAAYSAGDPLLGDVGRRTLSQVING